MKRLAASILFLSYFIFSTGFVVSVHWCMNKVDSVQWGDVSNDECTKCGMHIEDSGGCCKDDVKMVKVQMDQQVAKMVSFHFSFPVVPVSLTNYHLAPLQSPSERPSQLAHGPPLPKDDTYLQNCVFRL